jgi:hypothetical protein
MILAWGAFRERLRQALASGDQERHLEGALRGDLYREIAPRLGELPLVDVDEEPPAVQILAVDMDDEGRFVYTIRETMRSGLAALVLAEEGLMEADLSMGESGLFRLDALRSADEPREGARTVEVETSWADMLPDDYAPPRYRVEPQGGEGVILGVKDLEGALEAAQGLSRDGSCYRVYDRDSLERRGALVARFADGRRIA